MADTGIFATTAEVIRKCGANASSVAATELFINDFMAQAESTINATVRHNFSDTYGALNTDVKAILKAVASDLASIDVITYDMSGFTTRGEAENMINVRRDNALRGLSILQDLKTQTFINGA